MKLQLGDKTIDPSEVRQVRRIGNHIVRLELQTSETLSVICGVRSPNGDNLIAYDGSIDELKACIERHYKNP